MADKTKIEWSDATWNPVYGCSKVSQGCKNCYAETFLERFRGVPGHVFENGFDVRLALNKLDQPLRWQKPRKIFVNSMSDLFHEEVPFIYIAAVFGVMASAKRHTFQVLTKRPKRMAEFFAWLDEEANKPKPATRNAWTTIAGTGNTSRIGEMVGEAAVIMSDDCAMRMPDVVRARWPLPNVWLGVSVENQKAADERIPLLLDVPAAVRFLSMEPLLGLVDLVLDAPAAHTTEARGGIDWVIVGGESGPRARPCDFVWIADIIDQCEESGVPCFVKQLGKVPTYAGSLPTAPMMNQNHADIAALVQMKHPKGGDKDEWPVRLQVQQMPKG